MPFYVDLCRKRFVNTPYNKVLRIVSCSRIPDSVGKDIEKACQSIYPLHDVYVRKVKMLKKPKFECKWHTAVTPAVIVGFYFPIPVGTHDDKPFRSQMIAWLLPIEITWRSHTRKPFCFHCLCGRMTQVCNSQVECKILNGFEAWWMKYHYSIIAVFTTVVQFLKCAGVLL